MTLLHFTFGALPYNDPTKGTHIVHAYIHQSEQTWTDSPRSERKAAADCAQIVGDIILRNINEDEDRLLQQGEMPAEVLPIFTFAIGVAWDCAAKMPTYKMMDYATLCDERRFAPVLAVGADLYHYTFSVLRKRERADRAKAGAAKYKWSGETLERGRAAFAAFCEGAKRRHAAWEINKRRFDCPNLRNGYCTPMKPECPCYCNGRCEEVKA